LLNTYWEDYPPDERERLRGRNAPALRAVRDAVRNALRGDPARLNDGLKQLRLIYQLANGRMALRPQTSVTKHKRLLLSAAELLADEAKSKRLRLCAECGWAFLDTTKNGRRRFCSTAPCANRWHVRAFRERR